MPSDKPEATGEGMTYCVECSSYTCTCEVDTWKAIANRRSELNGKLTATVRAANDRITELETELDRLRVEVARLAAGLKPFADAVDFETGNPDPADDFPDHITDDQWIAARDVFAGSAAALEAYVAGRVGEKDAEIARLKDQLRGLGKPPDHCPVTGRSFFMVIENELGHEVATYGGPFDSYTIPEWNEEDKEFRSERYDHDAGGWVDGGEPYPFVIVDEQELQQLEEVVSVARSMRGLLLNRGIVKETSPVIAAFDAAAGKGE